jgi:flagellin-like protein
MRNITKFRRSVRAISPIISTLLLIAIAVVASLVAYAWVMGYIGFSTSKAGNALEIQSYTTSGNLVVYVQNTGQNVVHLKHDGSVYVNGNLENILFVDGKDASNGQLDPIPVTVGQTKALTIDFRPTSGEVLNIKVVTVEGTTIQGSTTATTEPGTAQVSFAVNPASSGATTPSATTPYTLGSSIQITCKAGSGYALSYWSSDSTITISNDQSAVTVATINGDGTIIANFVSASSPRLSVSGGASQTVLLGQISGAITIQRLQDSSGSITVNLASSSKTGTFYQDSSGTTPIKSIPIASQGGSATIYYGDSTVGTAQLTFSATGYSPANTAFTIQTVQTPVLTTLKISPGIASISAGASQAFTAQGFDQNGKSMGDYTASTTFSASGASVTGASVSATTVGSYTVTGTCKGITSNSASLTVTAGPAKTLTISPGTTSITAGGSQAYTASAQDAYGNSLGDVTSGTTFTVSQGATVSGNYVSSTTVGSYTVTGTDGSATTTATLQVTAGSTILNVAGFTSPITAGTSSGLTITAQDQYGNIISGYTGTVHFTSSDTKATLPPDYTFTSTDAGTHTFSGVTLETAGAQLITATDTSSSSITGSQTGITVNAAEVTQFAFSPISTQTAGVPFTMTITATDAYGNAVPSYSGSATLSDLSGSLNPTTATFNDGVCSNLQLTITKTITGQDIITAQDTGSNIAGQSSLFTLNPGNLAQFAVSDVNGPVTAGSTFTLTVTAQDASGNTVPTYAGSTTATLIDLSGSINPASLSSGWTNGVWTSSTVTITAAKTADVITATDGTTTGSDTAFNVVAGSLDHFAVSTPTNVQAGTAFTLTVTAVDVYNNPILSFSSTTATIMDSSTTIAPASLNSGWSNGVWTSSSMTVTKALSGDVITASDPTSGITGKSSPFNVASGPLASFALSTVNSPQTAGTAFSITITAIDQFQNTVTSYAGPAQLSDLSGSLSPTAATFTAGVCSNLQVTITKTWQNDKIAVADSGSNMVGYSSQFTVNPGALGSFTISSIDSTQTAGQAIHPAVTITAYDVKGNLKTDYTGSAATIKDNTNSLTTTGSFVGGVWSGTMTITTASTNDAITITDASGTSPITATSTPFNVNAALLGKFTIGNIAATTAGTTFSVTVTAVDQYNNVIPGYTGSVILTDLSGASSLQQQGTGVFNQGICTIQVYIKTAYQNDVITATDQNTGMHGTSNQFTVSAGQPGQLIFNSGTGQSILSGAVSKSITVQLQDKYGNPATAGSGGVSVTLTTGSSTGAFYSDAAGNTKITAPITIASGQTTSAGFYYKDSGADISPTLTASSGTLTPATMTIAINDYSLSFSATQNLAPGQMSQAITITRSEGLGNFLSTATVTLSCNDSTGHFYASASGGTPIPSVQIGILQASATVYFMDTAAGSPVLTATCPDYTTATVQFTVYSPTLDHFTISAQGGGNIGTQATGKAFGITITAVDQKGATLSSYIGTNSLSASLGTINPTTSGAFTNGVWTGSVSLNTAGSVTISTSGSGKSGTSLSFTVYTPAIDHYTITANSYTQTAGTAFSITITAIDQNGAVYTGTVPTNTLTVSGGGTISPTNPGAFTNGVCTPSVTLTKAGSFTITAGDGKATGTSNSFTISPGALASLTMTGTPTSVTAGSAFSNTVVVTAYDAYGNIATNFRGQVSFSSTDSQATLPNSYTFTSGDNGVHSFAGSNFMLGTVGSQTIKVASGTVSITSGAITVNPGALAQFSFNTISSPTAGTPFSITITAQDAYGNTVTSYSGTNTLTVSSGTISPTGTTVFSAGVWTGSVTLYKAGQLISISTSGNSKTGKSNTFTVNPGALASFTITGYPTSLTHGHNFGYSHSVVVTAYDANGNIATNYVGSVYFTSSDTKATLPYTATSMYTFTSGDAGTYTFSGSGFTLNTVGSQTITVTTGTISTTSSTINVS